MERSRHLFRSLAVALALLMAAVLLYWKGMIPALELNRERDARYLELLRDQEVKQSELEWLEAKESAITDPIEIEREHRRQFGRIGLPRNEVPLIAPSPSDAPADGTLHPDAPAPPAGSSSGGNAPPSGSGLAGSGQGG